MDGNGRWARSKNLSRNEGHRRGAEVLDELFECALEIGISAISLYAFSTENWKRPTSEITALFHLLDEFIISKIETLQKNSIRLIVSGNLSKIPSKSIELIKKGTDSTRKNKAMIVNFCISYGSIDELERAITSLIENRVEKAFKKYPNNQKAFSKALTKKIKMKEINRYLDTRDLPEVDLLIRTSGEMRLSNFLLLQSAYAELYFTKTLWPDFSRFDLLTAIDSYQTRDRKFGGIDE